MEGHDFHRFYFENGEFRHINHDLATKKQQKVNSIVRAAFDLKLSHFIKQMNKTDRREFTV